MREVGQNEQGPKKVERGSVTKNLMTKFMFELYPEGNKESLKCTKQRPGG